MRKSKFFSIFVAVIMAFGIVACDNNVEYLNINNEVPPSIEVNDACEIRNAIRAVITDLRTQEIVTSRDIEATVHRAFGIDETEIIVSTRSTSVVSDKALFVVDELAAVEALDFLTHTEYLSALDNVLKINRSILTNDEFKALSISLDVIDAIVDVLMLDEFDPFDPIPITPARLRDWWSRNGKCVSGALGIGGGAAVAGFFAGGPWGALAAGVFGTLYGYAEFCHELLFPPEKIIPGVNDGQSVIGGGNNVGIVTP